MTVTRPRGEQLRFESSRTGPHVLDDYLEAAEMGGRTLSDILADLFSTTTGQFRTDIFEFREDPSSPGTLQFRVGDFPDSTSGWQDLSFTDFTAYVTACQLAETHAETAETNSETAQAASQAARDLAQKWASNPENTVVSSGKYSALHYANKSAASAASSASSNASAAIHDTNANQSAQNASASESAALGYKNDAQAAAASFTPASLLASIKTVDGAGSGLDANFLNGQPVQASSTDLTLGRILQVGAFGMGARLNLRGTAFTTGTPADIDGTGTVVGMADGGPVDLNIPGLTNGTYGILRSEMHWSGTSATEAQLQTFQQGPDTIYTRRRTGTTAWSAWTKQPTNADISALNTSISSINTSLALKLNASAYTAADVLAKLKTVDGSGSGLDTDLFDGQNSSYYTDIVSRLGYAPINKAGDNLIESLFFGPGGLGAMMSEATVRVAPPTGNANVIANAVDGSAIVNANTTSSTGHASVLTQTDIGLNAEWQSYGSAYAGGTRFGAGPGGTAFSAPRNLAIGSYGNYGLDFHTNNTYRGAFLPNGYFLVGATSSASAVAEDGVILSPTGIVSSKMAGTGNNDHISFFNNAAVSPNVVGVLRSLGNDLTLYATAGDLNLVAASGVLTFNGDAMPVTGKPATFGASVYSTAADNNHYGFFGVSRLDGARGAYFGWGDGNTTVNIALDAASILDVTGGSLRNNGSNVVTAATFGSTMASSFSVGALGAYVMAARASVGAALNPNNTLAGSALLYSDGNGGKAGALGGTLKCMGFLPLNSLYPTLFLRLA